jgi:hypothetical protein
MGGIILVDKIQIPICSLPLKEKRERAYAAHIPTAMERVTDPVITMSELKILGVTDSTLPADSSIQ